MYQIQRQLNYSENWSSLPNIYDSDGAALSELAKKREDYPHAKYRLIKFEVVTE